jgi:hypothetical protein
MNLHAGIIDPELKIEAGSCDNDGRTDSESYVDPAIEPSRLYLAGDTVYGTRPLVSVRTALVASSCGYNAELHFHCLCVRRSE